MRSWSVALVLSLAVVAACAPATRLTAVWSAPEAPKTKFTKVLVAAQTPDETRRRAIETALVKRIDNATPSYQLFSSEDARDRDRARAAIGKAGFDGAVVVRFVGSDKQTTYVPGTTYWGPAPYASMWGYWGYGWGAVYDPGYMKTDEVITLETNVYSVARDELLWSSRSETISPSSVDTLIDSVVHTTVVEMKRRKVL